MSKKLLLILLSFALLAPHVAFSIDDMAPAPASELSFFPVLPANAPPDATPELIPIANNHPLGGAHPGISRVVIAIHDSSRNARGMLTILSILAGANADKLLLLAPQFLIPDDVDRFYEDVPEILRRSFVTWSVSPGENFYYDWQSGGISYAKPAQKPVSSFTVMDLLLMYLGQKQAFPDLKEIIIAGHGSGADYIQRYATMGAAIPVLEKQGISLRFLVTNPSSFLYVTNTRPRRDSVGFAPPNGTNCDYNFYKYGLEKMNTYAGHIGANAIKLNLGERFITYLLGEGVPGNDPFPEESCAAATQGPNRVARGLNYSLYLSQLYGEDVLDKQKFYTIPKIGYDPVAMFNTPCGMSVLFGDGQCGTVPKETKILQ